jgi:hypothetical protein
VNLRKLIFVLLLLPILVGCDAGFNIRTGKTKVAEARECYEAMKAIADTSKLEFESPNKSPEEFQKVKSRYQVALRAAVNWSIVACKDVKI